MAVWLIVVDDRDAPRLSAEHADGHSFILRCGTAAAPVIVKKAVPEK